MKKALCFLMLSMGIVSLALAQTKTPVIGQSSINSSSQSTRASYAPMHALNVQLDKSLHKIQKDLNTGKLTQNQAQADKEIVRAIQSKETQCFRSNGYKPLTLDQITPLNQSLAQLNSSL